MNIQDLLNNVRQLHQSLLNKMQSQVAPTDTDKMLQLQQLLNEVDSFTKSVLALTIGSLGNFDPSSNEYSRDRFFILQKADNRQHETAQQIGRVYQQLRMRIDQL